MSSDPLPRALSPTQDPAAAGLAAPALHIPAPAIRVENVSKMYRLFDSRGDRLKEALNPFGKRYHRPFWALRDIDLEVPRGQTVGILGMNGSGKSTLLQIIAGVLSPTTGRVVMEGRLAALLELGAGFNQDLSGRENVIMNSTIMGLSRREIDSRLAEIEAFADIGDFFDQPVKTYSSGMFVRVAFSAAIHVDPEVLIVDEALSVGDARFQEKSYRKFASFKEAGKTIIYVTHDRSSVLQLCDFAVLLHKGELVETGEPRRIVNMYSEILYGGLRSAPTKTGRAAAGGGEIRRVGSEATTEQPPAHAAAPQPKMNAAEPQATAADRSERMLEHPAVAEWLRRLVPDDNAARNPIYNKDEHSWGDGRAHIVDFLTVSGDRINPPSIESGEELDILVKVAFDEDLPTPLVGIGFRTPKGVLAYATHNGWLSDEPVTPATAGEVRVYRFRVSALLQAGPWFLQLAVAANQEQICNIRTNIAVIELVSAVRFDGLAQLPCSCDLLAAPAAAEASAAE